MEQDRIIKINIKNPSSTEVGTSMSGTKDPSSDKLQLKKHYHNLKEILRCTNATPIGTNRTYGYTCYYCDNCYQDPIALRNHTRDEHDTANFKDMKFTADRAQSYCTRLDITSLKCKLCEQSIDTLEQLITHLIDHKRSLYTDIKNQILPFKFHNVTLLCFMCSEIFLSFKSLQEHMNNHYSNYTCNVCGTGYVNRNKLNNHLRTHKTGVFRCEHCSKVFDTLLKKKYHEKQVHVNALYVNNCGHCDMKFKYFYQRQIHLAQAHGVKISMPQCEICDEIFPVQNRLTRHMKQCHLKEKQFECQYCDKKFFASSFLKSHLLTHTKECNFECDICHKRLRRKASLQLHMKTHLDDSRIKCEQCGKTFVHQNYWKAHMKSKHGVEECV